MSTIIERAEVHAALGEPSRLALVETLMDSDRSVGELSDMLGVPSNLLAHHLDVLEAAGVIERVVSSGDARRRYVRLRAASVDSMSLVAEPLVATAVLFVCTHNSARSQLAAAAWRREFGGQVASAGTDPASRVHPDAVAAAKRAGLDITRSKPRALNAADLDTELVITVCDRAREELRPGATWRHWSVPDPVEVGGRRAFDAALELIDEHVRLTSRVAA